MTFVAKKNILKRILPLVLLLAVSVAAGVTGATILHEMKLENPLKTPPVEGEVIEELDKGAKKVSFTNKGEADVFLRVAYTETWIAEDGKTILPNIAEKEDGTMVILAEPNWTAAQWDRESIDNWYYYKKVLPGSAAIRKSKGSLKEQDKNTGYLVDGVTFHLDNLKDTRYQKADYQLHFTMEVVQASDDWEVSRAAVSSLFDKNLSEPGGWSSNKYTALLTWPRGVENN